MPALGAPRRMPFLRECPGDLGPAPAPTPQLHDACDGGLLPGLRSQPATLNKNEPVRHLTETLPATPLRRKRRLGTHPDRGPLVLGHRVQNRAQQLVLGALST